jgi:hypothetical protein
MPSPQSSTRLRTWVALGATLGAAALSAVVLAERLASLYAPSFLLPENILLHLLGAVPNFIFRPYFILFLHGGYVYGAAFLPLLLWRRSRRWTLLALRALVAALAAWVAAMACATAYALDRSWGLLPGLLALPMAALLARWRRWRSVSTYLLAAGFALGTLLAQGFYSLPFHDDFEQFPSPLWAFLPPVGIAVLVAGALCLMRPPTIAEGWRRRGLEIWGLLTCALACGIGVAAEMRGMQVREPTPQGSRILNDWAYDVYVTGDPPQLVWTDRRKIHVMTGPYGGERERYTVLDHHSFYAERIVPSQDHGFYFLGLNHFEWWKEPRGGERLTQMPTERYPVPAWLHEDSSTTWTVDDDPVTGRFVSISEYYSHYAVIDRRTRQPTALGVLSSAFWPFWYFTADPQRRVLYATSALDDGGLYELDLDTLSWTHRASNLYVYETELDKQQGLLWGVRSLTGEVVAVDTATYEMRHRLPVQFGLRGMDRDPDSGDVYVCSEIYGDIFRIDTRAVAVSHVGWCGRLCRSLYFDSPRRTLWVATRDGICRISTGE